MRQLLHKLVGVLFWLLLAACWAVLIRQHRVTAPSITYSLGYLAVVSGAVLAVTTWWIRHNVGIYRRKGPRQGRASVAPRMDEDRLGRPVRWELPGDEAAATRHLVVELRGDVKVYRSLG